MKTSCPRTPRDEEKKKKQQPPDSPCEEKKKKQHKIPPKVSWGLRRKLEYTSGS